MEDGCKERNVVDEGTVVQEEVVTIKTIEKTTTEEEKKFASHIYDKGPVFRIYKEF